MQTLKLYLKYFLFFSFLILIINGCKKDKTEETPVTPPVTGISLTPEKTTVMPFEVIYFTNTGQGVLNANSYSASINGSAVALDKMDNKLWMLMPNIAPGTYVLTGTLEGSSININFTVNALPVIADPNAYYNNWQTQFLASRQAAALLGDSLVQAGLISATALANDQNVITQIYDSANYYWNQLSPQERISAAGLMELDKPILDNLELLNVFSRAEDCFGKKNDAEQIIYNSDSDEEKAKKQAYKLLYLKCLSVVYSEKYNQWDYALAKSFVKHKNANIVKQLLFASFNYLGQVLEKMYESNVQKEVAKITTLGEALDAKFINLVSINRIGISHVDFTNNIAREIMPEIIFESIKASDVLNSNSIPKNYATSLSTLRNDFISRFNSMLPAPLQMIPEFSNASKTTVYNRDISIANISNSNVTGTCQLLNNKLMLEFNTTQTTTQNFTFDLVYTNPDVGTASTNIGATLAVNNCDGTLNVTETRNGKTITAAATGGTPPYEFKFYSHNHNIQEFSSNNSFILVYDGKYTVIVKDANGCADTVKNSVFDVVINSITCVASDSTSSYPDGDFRISYSSTLGLIPEFFQKTTVNQIQKYGLMGWLITESTNSNWPADMPDYCSETGGSGPVNSWSTGDDFNRTVKFNLYNNVQPLGGTTIHYKLLDNNGGTTMCPAGPYYKEELWGVERVITW